MSRLTICTSHAAETMHGWLAHPLEPHISDREGGRSGHPDGDLWLSLLHHCPLSLSFETGKALSHAPDSLVAAMRSLVRALELELKLNECLSANCL